MQTLGRTLAAFCGILFMITGVTAVFLFNIERKAFSAETYKQAFEAQALYNRMPAMLAEALTSAIQQNESADEYLKPLTIEDWESAISSLLPPEDMKVFADNTLDSVFGYLNDRTDSAVISLVPLKSRLAGPAGFQAVLQILNAQPDCTLEQLIQMAVGFLSEGRLIFCNPPPEAIESIRPLIETQLQSMTFVIPDQVTLISNAHSGTPDDPRLKLKAARSVMQIAPLFPIMFLLGLTIFAVRGLIDWLRWWGWPFLLTGLISYLIAISSSSVFGFIFQDVMERQTASFMPPVLLMALRETVSAIVHQILQPVTIEGLILAVVGLLMILLAVLLATTGKAVPRSQGWR